jgi:hypothetical protein
MLRELASFAVICLGTLSVARADTLLIPGGSLPPDLLFPNGTILAQSSGTVAVSGLVDTYTVFAYKDMSNVLCSGCIDFLYHFNNVGSTGNISFTMINFEDWLTVVGFNAGAGVDINPSMVSRSSDGSAISFLYSPSLAPGHGTSQLVIETNASDFSSGGFTISDGIETGSQGAFAPTPEPATLALFGTGLLGFVGVARRKLKV